MKWICLIPSLQGLSGTGSLDFERVGQEELALQSAQPLWAHFQVLTAIGFWKRALLVRSLV